MMQPADDHFLLGLFGPNCSSGVAVTTVPERWSGSWQDNLRLASLADEVGVDFFLPIARWLGFGGRSRFQESVLEPMVYATGILACTRRVSAFATIHTAFRHPLVAAKELATADQVAPGRIGLNIVAGWNKPEFDAFGIDLPHAHAERYGRAEEWFDVVRRVWREDKPFDYEGRFFRLKGVEGVPKPGGGRVPVVSAGSSVEGRAFAARNADFIFTIVAGPEPGAEVVREITAEAKGHGRMVGVLTMGHVVCRPTRQEAVDYLHYYAEEKADHEAVDTLMRELGLLAQSYKQELLREHRIRFAAGHGSCPLVGTPDDVAAEIARFQKAGFAGMTLSFVDYVEGLKSFADEVLPRLEAMGVRQPMQQL